MFSILPITLRTLLAVYLWRSPDPSSSPTGQTLEFELKHVHAVASNSSRNIFSTIDSAAYSAAYSAFSGGVGKPTTYTVHTRDVLAHKASSHAAFSAARLRSKQFGESEGVDLKWQGMNVRGPDVEKRETLKRLAEMTANSYFQPSEKGWRDLGPDWNASYSYGWEPDADGFRGHVFVATDESTVVISVKGTSAPWLVGGGGPTTHKDKLNDNLLFSCCCAKVGPTWSAVCGCHEGGWKCDLGCLEKSLVDDSLFYGVGVNLYNNITYMYPNSDIWIIGHSLGGSLASLMGATFGIPVVAFEAPAERMAARRLHLPSPPSVQHITHVFNTADPIPMGQCTGVTSSCATGGYALESQCHMGTLIVYDTVSKLGWSSSVKNHQIDLVIDQLLSKDWEEADTEGKEDEETEHATGYFKWPWGRSKPDKDGKDGDKPRRKGRAVPKSKEEDPECQDCFKWEIGNFRPAS